MEDNTNNIIEKHKGECKDPDNGIMAKTQSKDFILYLGVHWGMALLGSEGLILTFAKCSAWTFKTCNNHKRNELLSSLLPLWGKWDKPWLSNQSNLIVANQECSQGTETGNPSPEFSFSIIVLCHLPGNGRTVNKIGMSWMRHSRIYDGREIKCFIWKIKDYKLS